MSRGTRREAAPVVSAALGETGAPWDDICPADSCEHATCDAIRALVETGLLADDEEGS